MVAFLDIFRKFRKFEKSTGTSVLGVDVGSSAIKLVQLRKEKGTVVLETYGELALGPYANIEIGRAVQLPIDKTVEALKDLLRESNTTTTSSGFSIPFASSLLTLIQMPSIDIKQLNKMIPLEARKYIPIPINEVMLDWFVIPDDNNTESEEEDDRANDGKKYKAVGKKEVLLVAIHNEVLNTYNSIVDQAELTTDFFEIEIFSTLRATLDQNLTPVMVMDIGAATTKVYIVEYGIVRSSHVINRGSQDITTGISKSLGMNIHQAEELKRQHDFGIENDEKGYDKVALLTLDYMFSEANRVLLNYEQKYSKNVGSVVLTGGGAVMRGMLYIAKKRLETETRLADPFSKVDTPAFLEDMLKEAGPAFSVAVGLALRKLHELE